MAEETGTVTADVAKETVDVEVKTDVPVTDVDLAHDEEDKEYKQDVDEAQKEWETNKVGARPGSARWNKIYWQSKEANRLGKELSEVKETIGLMRKHNEDLMKVVTETKDTVSANVRDKFTNDIQTIKTNIQTLKQQRREAAAINDMATAFACEDRIEELREYLEQVSKSKGEDIPAAVDDAVQKAEDKRTYSKFIKDTEWYNTKSQKFDDAMSAYADKLWKKATENWSGTYEENLYSVKERVEKRFGHTNGNGKPHSKPMPNVQGADNTVPIKGTNVELTQEEQRVAVNMFSELSPNDAIKRYANQKAIIAKNREAR